MILGELDLDIGPALAGLGVVGIAVGFGTQSIVRDYFNGRADPDREPVQQGRRRHDRGRDAGTVEDFSLRRTTLRDLDGVVHTVPNGEIKVASNRTRVWARDQPRRHRRLRHGHRERATRVVNDVGEAMAADPAWRRRRASRRRASSASRRSASTGSRSRCWAWCGRPSSGRPAASSASGCSAAFATHGIEIPRPQRVVLARDPPSRPVRARRRHAPGPDPGRPLRRTRTEPRRHPRARRWPARVEWPDPRVAARRDP